ncbi:MAG: hypothetical protein LBB93_06465 [Elusimicrobiota bacterium]|jgi:TM2 domain-containing membrane protein YozV|nr:hypothetical protein [Elusimicrobiota bacterium]
MNIVKYAAALLLNFLVCPGAGHILIGQFRKGLIIIGIVFAVFLIAVSSLMSSIDLSQAPQNYTLMKEYIMNLIAEDSNLTLFMDIALAALYAYAGADLFFGFIAEMKKRRDEK